MIEGDAQQFLADFASRTEQAYAARNREFAASLAAAPKEKQCDRHSGRRVHLDQLASEELGDLVYPCPDCEADAIEADIRRRLRNCGVPERVRHATLANFELGRPVRHAGALRDTPACALDAARAFLAGNFRNLVLCGTPGTGKGHLAAAILRERNNRRDAWITIRGYLKTYHNAYADGSTDYVVRHYASRPLLVLDEAGLGEPPKDGEAAIYELIDSRWNLRRPTIILGNLTARELSEKWFGPRIADRLAESCRALWMDWQSYRRAAA